MKEITIIKYNGLDISLSIEDGDNVGIVLAKLKLNRNKVTLEEQQSGELLSYSALVIDGGYYKVVPKPKMVIYHPLFGEIMPDARMKEEAKLFLKGKASEKRTASWAYVYAVEKIAQKKNIRVHIKHIK